LLIATATAAEAKHLLHKVPQPVGDKMLLECQRDWNGAFGQGWCADQRAQEWLDAHDPDRAQKANMPTPDLLVSPPKLIVRPTEGDGQ
jgi:hypothetical protein